MTGWFDDVRLRWKLLGGFGAVVMLMIGVGYVGISNMARQDAYLDEMHLQHVLGLSAIMQANVDLVASGRDEAEAVLADDRAEIEKYAALSRKLLASTIENLDLYEQRADLSETRQSVEALRNDLTELRASHERVLELAIAGKDAEARAEAAKGRVVADRVEAEMDKLQASEERQGQRASDDATAEYLHARAVMLGLVAVAVALAMSIALLLTRAIAGAVGRVGAAARHIAREDLPSLVTVAKALAAGDLTHDAVVSAQRVEVRGKDELGTMAGIVNAMIDGIQETGAAFAEMSAGLRETIGQVQEAAVGLAGTSAQLGQVATQTSGIVQQVTMAIQNVAAGSTDTSGAAQVSNLAVEELSQAIDGIARGAAEQASQIQVVSATAAQMATGVEQVAVDAGAVATASARTKASAERGAHAVNATVEGIVEIKHVVATAAERVEQLGKLSEKIGAVVETIDDIAEQTNLLALNAAIEAARAGEHGRGFAIVADEVRKLAERSQRETRSIADLIHNVQASTKDAVSAMERGSAKVNEGAARADEAGRSLTEILHAVDLTVAQVTQIATAAQDMAGGAREVMDVMGTISAVVEQSTAATEEMAAQAGQVTTSIGTIASISEENSAASEEVSASAEEMSAQVEEMTAQAEELAATAEQLKSLVARFRLDNGNTSALTHRRRAGDWGAAPRAGLRRAS
jgi:methyl-accepting chemotaxis protein